MMTRQELLQETDMRLEASGIDASAYESRVLLEWALGIDRSDYYLDPLKPVSDEQADRLRVACERRCNHEPLQYIMGYCDFYGYTFLVTPDVLIPRLDTEVLVEEFLGRISDHKGSVLDLCSGSGCIGITIKKECPDMQVTLGDLSEEALAISKENAEALDAEVRLTKTDVFSGLAGMTFDYIVSNPPYIPSEEIEELMPEVRCHEPRMALDGSEDGLYFYKRITREAPEYLKKGGMLFFEIGAKQGAAVSALMRMAGFASVTVKKDLAGLDRVVYGVKR